MLPPLANRRKPTTANIATLAALLLQLAALLFAMWHGAHILRTMEARETALEHLVEHVDLEVTEATHTAPVPSSGAVQPRPSVSPSPPAGAPGPGVKP